MTEKEFLNGSVSVYDPFWGESDGLAKGVFVKGKCDTMYQLISSDGEPILVLCDAKESVVLKQTPLQIKLTDATWIPLRVRKATMKGWN